MTSNGDCPMNLAQRQLTEDAFASECFRMFQDVSARNRDDRVKATSEMESYFDQAVEKWGPMIETLRAKA